MLLTLLLLGQTFPPPTGQQEFSDSSRIERIPRVLRPNGRTAGLAFFEFAPASGQGLTAPCACASVTGAKGEAVTWTRGSSAMCTKSASETSIANGDLVLCGNNLPRVMSLGGPLGVLVESSRANDNLWGDDLGNAAYTSPVSGVAAVTVTSNFAVGPTGATNATRLQFPATTGAQYSLRAQVAGVAAVRTGSVYVKGNGTSGAVDLVWGSVGAQCGTCAFNATTWTRCIFPTASAVNTFEFGNDSADCASAARAAVDVLVAGVQSEIGAYATSYIPTTTVAVTRSADLPFATVATWPSASVSAALTVTQTQAAGQNFTRYLGLDAVIPNGAAKFLEDPSTLTDARLYDGTAYQVTLSGITRAQTERHYAYCSAAGSGLGVNAQSATSAGVCGPVTGATSVALSDGYTVGVADGIVSRVCYDPSPSRCR